MSENKIPHIVHNDKQGFTLVELAIALMVIGLLIGGVLKGQELIENAKMTAFIRQIKAYDTATLIFKSTYGALPGDMKRPTRIPNCDQPACSLSGNGNGRILYTDTSPLHVETYNFFPHMTKAGMLQGPEGGTQVQLNVGWNQEEYDLFFYRQPWDTAKHGGVEWRENEAPHLASHHYYTIGYINGNIAQTVDNKMDDGNPVTGIVLDLYGVGNSCVIENDDGSYSWDTVTANLAGNCLLVISAGF